MFRRDAVGFVCSCALLLAACAPEPPAAAPPPAVQVNAPDDLAAVNDVRNKFMAAYNSGNAEAIASLYTADAVSEPNHTATLTGRDAILGSQKAMFERVTVKVTLTPDETTTRGQTGYDRGHYSVEATPKDGGPVVTNEGRYLVLLVKESDGTWKVARDMDNASAPSVADMPEPAAAK